MILRELIVRKCSNDYIDEGFFRSRSIKTVCKACYQNENKLPMQLIPPANLIRDCEAIICVPRSERILSTGCISSSQFLIRLLS